jgi:hypothetical protein
LSQQIRAKVEPAVRSVDASATYSAERTQLIPNQCCFWLQGGGADGAWTLWKGLGVAASLTGVHVSNFVPDFDINKITYLAGPRYTFTTRLADTKLTRVVGAEHYNYQIFAQSLFGETHAFNSFFPAPNGSVSNANAFALQAGGGVNLLLTRHFGLRLIEADYLRTELPNNADNLQNSLRLSAGVTCHFTEAALRPVMLAATASPTAVFAGTPVTLIATASNLNPKQNTIYRWLGSGVSGKGATTTVATASLTPGTYTVKATVKEGKVGKEGLQPGKSAEASASFTVKPFDPPRASCSANPSSVNPGDSSTITSSAVSPQNRPLAYSYNATVGSINGIGSSSTLSTKGAAPGPITVTCNVSDDKSHKVSATTSVKVIAPPPPPPAPQASSLCPVSFERDAKRPTRVDNEAKACLDDIALNLTRLVDAKLALVGNEDAKEQKADAKQQKLDAKLKHNKKPTAAAARVVNTKEYLVTDKGIDASRILVYIGTDDGKTVISTLIPSGATNPAASDAAVNETAVKAVSRTPVKNQHRKTNRKK